MVKNGKLAEDFLAAVEAVAGPFVGKDEKKAAVKRKKPDAADDGKDSKDSKDGAGAAAGGAADAPPDFTSWKTADGMAKLDKHTMPELKEYLKAHKLPVSGKKQELVDRVLAHLKT